MKIFVNGDEIELQRTDTSVNIGHDRLIVRSPLGTNTALAQRVGDTIWVSFLGHQYRIETKARRAHSFGQVSTGELRAPMPGSIVAIRLNEGAPVKKGDTILVLEAMKTQQPFHAPFDGVLAKVLVAIGDQVSDGAILAIVEPLS